MAALPATPAAPLTRDGPPALGSPLVLSTRSLPGPDGPAPRPASVLIQNVKGAEGGVEAITARRRNSGSFKTMSSGGLVSNSPFAKRLGQATSPTKPAPAPVNHGLGLYSPSRVPAAATGVTGSVRRSSGSRRASGEHNGPVKENSDPSELNELAGIKADDARSRSTSPGVPFRPVRQQAASSAPSSTTAAPVALPTSVPFKPSRPAFVTSALQDEAGQPRRQTSSYAHLRKNNLVSSSPFTSQQAQVPSPELPHAPYEIGALTLESAPMEYFDVEGEHSPHLPPPAADKPSHAVGLGARPGRDMPTAVRHVAGASVPPATTAAWRYSGEVGSPPAASAMSPVRRGMRGPRPLDGAAEPEGDELSRTVRRQPSSKSVAWAETEEVFEFEVEEERRRSMMSDASTLSDEGRYYGGSGGGDRVDSSEDDDDSFTGPEHASYSFDEGGSVEVHDLDAGSDAEESVVSNTSSAMDEVIGQIDSYLHEESYDETDVFSPSQIPSFSDGHDQPDLPSHRTTPGYASPQVAQVPPSAFSVSTVPGGDDAGSDVMSTSAYDDDDDEVDEAHFAATRNAILARGLATIPATPMSPPRPPLPSPPIASRAPTADPIPSSLLAHSDSQFSLPDIPGTSPFIGFEDDGAAEAVVSLSNGAPPHAAIPTTRPLSLHSQTSRPVKAAHEPVPEESTPTKATPGLEPSPSIGSPILAAMHRSSDVAPGSASPTLSRKASLVGSDVTTSSTSWYVSSVTGSLRGGRVGGGLESAMKRHAPLLGASLSSSTSSARPSPFGTFPAAVPTSPAPSSSMLGSAGKSTPATSRAGSDAAAPLSLSSSRAIEARPAPKAYSATLSSGMLPTIAASAQRTGLSLGSPLTARVAEEMQSPLERLQAGMKGREGAEWRSGDSLLGVAEEGHADGVDEVGSLKPCKPEVKRLTRRRSRSTGDADVAETTSSLVMQPQHAMPELGFEQRPDDAAFGSSVLESLDDIYNSRNRTYRVRESKRLVVVSDFAGSKAGDVDPGRAWRKKRPSDVHAINRSVSTMSINSQAVRKNREFSGQLFVLIREATFEGMPLPRSKVMVTAALDNGRQCVNVASRELSTKVSLRKEFELVCNQDLAFSIKLSVPLPPKAPIATPVVAAPVPPSARTPPASPSKAHRAFRIFSSPKKKATPPVRPLSTPVAPPPTPDPFYDYVASDGQLATARVTFASEAAACRLKKSRVVVPFAAAAGSARTCKGALAIDLLFVPAVPGVPKANLPKSMDQVIEGLELADWASKITHESVLTQLGGDTTVWRRRIVKLRGSKLVPYSEVTKRSHVEINLAHVVSVEDLNAPISSRASRFGAGDDDDDESLARMDHSFRLVFRDGNRIDFFADSDAIKDRWLEVLLDVVGKEDDKKTPPDWAVAVRKLPAPKTLQAQA
ncbi:hypothetical protein JCM3770_006791 [Rhodotorula araucariae]